MRSRRSSRPWPTFPDDPWDQLACARCWQSFAPGTRPGRLATGGGPGCARWRHGGECAGDGLRQSRVDQPARESRSRAILRPANRGCSANTCRMPRAKMSSPGFARRSRFRRWPRITISFPHHAVAFGRSDAGAALTGTCRISSSPWSEAGSGCCKPAPASGRRTAAARIAVDMAEQGLIDETTAVSRVSPARWSDCFILRSTTPRTSR